MTNIINLYTYKEADYIKKIDQAIRYERVQLIQKLNEYRRFLGLRALNINIQMNQKNKQSNTI